MNVGMKFGRDRDSDVKKGGTAGFTAPVKLNKIYY